MDKSYIQKQIASQADLCVKCGLCLPGCPTYQLTQDENESPRGRIALMEAVATEQLPMSKAVEQSLDHCLRCGHCESMCPAHVPFERLIVQHKAIKPSTNNTLLEQMLLNYVAARSSIRRLGGWLSYVAKQLHLTFAHPFIRFTQRPQRFKPYYPTQQKRQGHVALFIGCIQPSFDTTTLNSTINVLNQIGYDVTIPTTQNCCGNLHFHEGKLETAKQLQANNARSFNTLDVDAIITTATGCHTAFANNASEYAYPVMDIDTFLNKTIVETEQFIACKEPVALHLPCTLKHNMKEDAALIALLKRIPNIELHILEGSSCCGASGLHMLKDSKKADNIAQPLLNSLLRSNAKILLSPNIGCSLHLQNSLQKQFSHIKLLHPVTFLLKQLAKK